MGNKTGIVSLPIVSVDVLLIFLSAVLTSAALMYVSAAVAWVALPLLLYTLTQSHSKLRLAAYGFLYGGISSLILNFWMITVIQNYAQGNFWISIAAWLSSAIVMAAAFAVSFFLYGILRFRQDHKFELPLNAVLFSGIWILNEWIRSEFLTGIPWVNFSIGVTQAENLYLIQLASAGGVHLLSFLLVLSSFIIAQTVLQKKYKLLLFPGGLLILQFVTGVVMVNTLDANLKSYSGKSFKASIVSPALPAEKIWNDDNANDLVKHIFALNKTAVAQSPDLILWTETLVPWTYHPDDDFLNVLLKNTSNKNLTLIGLNTSGQNSDLLYNSIYLFNSDKKNLARYDKQQLLTIVEKPIIQNSNLILPFLSNAGVSMHPGKQNIPINTSWGNAGILICNESTSGQSAYDHVKNGATFLINPGNDNWFANNFITRQHFYNCRLRAVETRKDLLMNHNMGYSGLIKANGEIQSEHHGKRSQVRSVIVETNNAPSVNTGIFAYAMFIILILLSTLKLLNF